MKTQRRNELAIAVSPGANHFGHIDNLIDSVKRYTSIGFHFCILASEKNDTLRNKENVTIKVIDKKDMDLFEELYCVEGKRGDIPSFVYAQIVIPEYFKEFKKILFLEVDQIVQKDLKELVEYVENNEIKLGAVPVPDSKEIPEHFLKSHPNLPYYNCGVVYIDVDFWIQNNLKDICFEECKKQKKSKGSYFRFYVQGAMNTGLSSFFKPIDLKYNFMGLGGGTGYTDELLSKQTILHWNGKRKPWNTDGLYKNFYYKQ
jgi:lipopolysaccharide biosynthesis glycosyltransferase